ncbi:PREDICTED: serine/threonine-protein kinase BLUS1 isoform X2 [Nelumbo nucifera]|uniref:Serine/threonine-protein kinase BLUS1 isoform X2 n=1 Tax=Nelumbo nucifera TaxID=4432 RepID=A0A1U7ZSM3_NELNU|nr:PREDICTED: serine/threonine-protein kinase BLUS1 isoform X2 [Nelumbo nucifera]
MEHIPEKRFPVNSNDYKLYEEVGEGVSATVYRALCIPFNEIVAIKVLDLEKCNSDLDSIRREVQTMSLIDHPNVLRAYCSFTADRSLWVVMPYMSGGSCLHIMKSAFPEGFEEPVIATLLREVLKALVYLHAHGLIHRDVKAGNILIDSNGAVKLGDFGVSACMFDTGDRQRSRNTFVGTPCWMAPEVMQQLHGYDFKADIWSFGITALELAHGHAPFSKYPPMKVLLMTLQNAPPGLDYERDKKFSKSFKEMVATCLVKDPKKRPTPEKLLKHSFFKHARSNDYLSRTILDGLSPLGDRFRMLKAKEADFLAQNKVMYGDKEQLSQREYIRGISAWNFNLEDLKAQAALIQDDGVPSEEDQDMNSKLNGCNVDLVPEQSPERVNNSNVAPAKDAVNDFKDMEDSLASFPIRPLQALNPNSKDAVQLDSDQQWQLQSAARPEDPETRQDDGENLERSSSISRYVILGQKFLSGSLLPENGFSPSRKVNGDGDREFTQQKYQPERNYSGPLSYCHKKDMNNITSVEDASEGTVVQRKGRFKVTQADLSPKATPAKCLANQVSGGSTIPTSTIPAALVLPSLQYILQQNSMQREQIIKLIKCVEQTSGHHTEFADSGTSDLSQVSPTSARERELLSEVITLQQSIGNLVEELQKQKAANSQLEKQLNDLHVKQEVERTRKE